MKLLSCLSLSTIWFRTSGRFSYFPRCEAWKEFMDSVFSLVSAPDSLLRYLDSHCSSCQLRQHCILTERSSQQYSLPIRGWQYSSQYSLPTSRLQGLQGGQGLGFQGFPGWQGLGFQDFQGGQIGFQCCQGGQGLGNGGYNFPTSKAAVVAAVAAAMTA